MMAWSTILQVQVDSTRYTEIEEALKSGADIDDKTVAELQVGAAV